MATKKRQPAVLLGGACVLALTACASGGGDSGSASAPKTITICNVTDLSGVQQPLSKTESAGGVVAADIINSAGGIKSLGGAKLVVKKFDTQSNPDMGAPQATKAVSAGCKAIWGGEITDTVLAATAVTHRAHIPWVDVGGIGDQVHKRGFNDVVQLTTTTGIANSYYGMLKYVQSSLGISEPTVGLSVSDTSYGQGFYAAWSELNKNGPFKIVSNVSYPLSTTDLSSIASRMASQHPAILFNMGYPADGIALARLFKQTFHSSAKAFFSTAQSQVAMSQLGSLANGQLYSVSSPPKSSPALEKFNQVYQSKIGSEPSIEAWQGYTAVMFIAAALQKAASTDGQAIASALHSVSLTPANGNVFPETLSFSSDGQPAHQPSYWVQDQNGKLVYVFPENLKQASLMPFGS